MKKLNNILFSMTTSVILLVIFAASIGYATFVESRESTEAARSLVYNAIWFETLLGLLVVNFIGSIFRFEIFTKSKLSIVLFHLAFVIILIGAAITRYVGSEGIMHIREGESSNEILTEKTSVRLTANFDGKTETKTTETNLNESSTSFETSVAVGNKQINCELATFIPNALEEIEADPSGEAAISIFAMNPQTGGTPIILEKGDTKSFNGVNFAFEDTTSNANIVFYRVNDALYFKTNIELAKTSMMDQKTESIALNQQVEAPLKTIFKASELLFVIKTYLPNARKIITQLTPEKNKMGLQMGDKNAYVFTISDGNSTKQLNLMINSNQSVAQSECTINGVKVALEYGTISYKLPFSIQLRDFVLDRYPGSNSPSSYASEITLIDTHTKTEMPYRIFMNNILKYKGYRFFQSSYDQDEQGTVLSVSNDYWGTTITYIGYFLLMFGMLLTMFNKNSRFRTLLKMGSDLQKKRMNQKTVILIASILISTSAFSATITQKSHIESLQSLLIQDEAQGRIEPFSTFASDLLRKINKSTSYRDISPTEVILGMLSNPQRWQNEPIIKVGNEYLAAELGAVDKYVSFNQLFDIQNGGNYRLSTKVEDVYKKEESTRTSYDKELLNIDERVNICYMIFSGEMLHLFPDPTNSNAKWTTAVIQKQAPAQADVCTRDKSTDESVCTRDKKTDESVCTRDKSKDSTQVEMGDMNMPENMQMPPAGMGGMSADEISSMMGMGGNSTNAAPNNLLENYLQAVNAATTSGDWQQAENSLEAIKNYQKTAGGESLPSESRIQLEVLYNNWQIFGKLSALYMLLGFALLMLYFYSIFKNIPKITRYLKWANYAFITAFGLYTLGMAARWYISDHAPWSNGYESMLLVGWAAALSGLIFSRRSPVSMAVTGILAGIALMVAGMSWMNPEITNLVPVLKSYWLIIHVAIITSSYGFLAMGAMLGLLNLLLMIARNAKNEEKVKPIIREINIIIELSLYVGLVLITAGCFIGGVWANESWGRYWGWDPKETWALVSILVYSAILHLRNIPKLNSGFILSSLSIIGFGSIIMTFLGVNYYLAGMHSYGKGVIPPLPNAVYFILLAIAVIIGWAYKAEKEKK